MVVVEERKSTGLTEAARASLMEAHRRQRRRAVVVTLLDVRAAVKAEITDSLARAAELTEEAKRMQAWLDRVEREEQE